MDPVSMIVAAVVAGAASGFGDTASQAVKDAYAALKARLSDRDDPVDVTPVERVPDSQAKQDSLAEDLAAAGAGEDGSVLDAAQDVIAAVAREDPDLASRVGVDLERIEAEFVRLRNIRGSDTAVRGRDWEIRGGIDIEGAGGGRRDPQ